MTGDRNGADFWHWVSGKGRRHGQQGIIASKEGAKVFCGVGHVDLGPFGRGQLGLCS